MNRVLSAVVLVITTLLAVDPALALVDGRIRRFSTAAVLEAYGAKDGDLGYALDTDTFYIYAAGSWAGISTLVSLTGDNGGTFANGTNNEWALTENSETLKFTFASNALTLESATGIASLTTVFDLSLGGGAGALTLTYSASSMVVPNNDPTAMVFGGSGLTNLLTLDTTTSAQKLMITGTTTATALHVDVGLALFDEAVTFGGGAGALTFTNSAASVLTIDNDTSAFDFGSADETSALRYSSANDAEAFTFTAGIVQGTTSITGAATLDASDCGKTHFVTAAHDGNAITLPATIAGCEFRFMYVGADGGALVDISPNASDAVHGTCIGVGVVAVEFNGTDDNDVGFTKATINTGDTMTLIGDGGEGWYVAACAGIAANN